MGIPDLNKCRLDLPEPYAFQTRTGNRNGNLILQSPTGSGKTKAAFLWARKNKKDNGRFFYTLPITASLNAMWRCFVDIFEDNKHELVGLLHSRVASSIYAMLDGDGIDKQSKSWDLSSLAREMYFPIRLCTPHQVLKFTLFGRGWEMMLSEFPNSVFVFDEVHAYNPGHMGLTMATAKYIVSKGGSVMFMSATLPKFLRIMIEKEIPGIELITPSFEEESDREIMEQKRHLLEVKEGDVTSNINFIIEEAKKAKSTLIVCNHVPTAQKVYKRISKEIDDVVLIHSRFTRNDRNEVEKRLLQSKLPQVLVSTQVVEVSLDINFQQGFTEPAPIEAIIQRLGRINRKPIKDDPPAIVRIFRKQASDDEHVYSEKLRNKSLEVLSEKIKKENPLSEETLIEAANDVYGNGYDKEEREEYDRAFACIQVQRDMLAGSNRNWVDDILDDDEGSIELLPDILEKYFKEKKEQKLFIEAFGLRVPVGKWRLKKLYEEDRIYRNDDDVLILQGCNYDSKLGLEILK